MPVSSCGSRTAANARRCRVANARSPCGSEFIRDAGVQPTKIYRMS